MDKIPALGDGFRSLFIFLLAAATIIIRSQLTESGYLTPDSSYYLAAAKSLLAGTGPHIANNGSGEAGPTYFATWPLGYPAIIAATSALTGADVFLSSKIANIALLAGSMMIVWRTFKPYGGALACILCFSNTIAVFSHTWSEAPYIFYMVALSALLGRDPESLPTSGRRFVTHLLALTLLGLMTFSARYIGAFSVANIALFGVAHFLRGRRRLGASYLVASCVIACLIAAYLEINESLAGTRTGPNRIPAPETPWELLQSLAAATVRELVLPLNEWSFSRPWEMAAQVLVLLTLALLVVKAATTEQDTGQNLVSYREAPFLTMGMGHLLAIITLRFITYFDDFNYRLLNPGFALIFIAALSRVLRRNGSTRRNVNRFIFIVAALSLLTSIAPSFARRTTLRYADVVTNIERRYRTVESGSVVVFGSIHLRYLRTDLHVCQPRSAPHLGQSDSWGDFLGKLDRNRPIYVDISNGQAADGQYHKSVGEYLDQNNGKVLVRIR